MEKHMALAVEKAKKGKTPFGAVIVQQGKLLAAVCNTVSESADPTAHAEVNAIREACKITGSHKLQGAVLYTTGEPCPMCAAAAIFAGISQIIYGASIPVISEYLPQIQLRAADVAKQSDHEVLIVQADEDEVYASLLSCYA
jgi:guanine deaminase